MTDPQWRDFYADGPDCESPVDVALERTVYLKRELDTMTVKMLEVLEALEAIPPWVVDVERRLKNLEGSVDDGIE